MNTHVNAENPSEKFAILSDFSACFFAFWNAQSKSRSFLSTDCLFTSTPHTTSFLIPNKIFASTPSKAFIIFEISIARINLRPFNMSLNSWFVNPDFCAIADCFNPLSVIWCFKFSATTLFEVCISNNLFPSFHLTTFLFN